MKLDRIYEQEELETIGDIKIIDYGIDSKNFYMAIKSFYQYSDPIGSFVREITSNCFDSHIEAKNISELSDTTLIEDKYYTSEEIPLLREYFKDWEDRPIRISLTKPNILTGQEASIKFQDFGVGLSLNRIEAIYAKFFSSTKRHGNDEIGAFGLGSKSPLGYSDIFYVTSVFFGVKRHCAIHKGNPVPQLEILFEEETDEINGTTVEVPISKEYTTRHIESIVQSIKTQLCYFDNIEYIGFDDLENFTIYRGEHFLYRNNSPFNQLHLAVGNVYYPLNFRAMDIRDQYKHTCPIALKIDIGDIDLVWNRESVEYTDKTKETITNKIANAYIELQHLYDKEFNNINSIVDYINLHDMKINDYIRIDDNVKIENVKYIVKKDISFPKYDSLGRIYISEALKPYYIFKRVKEGRVSSSKRFPFNGVKQLLFNRKDNHNDEVYLLKGSISSTTNKYLKSIGKGNFYLIKRHNVIDFYKNKIYEGFKQSNVDTIPLGSSKVEGNYTPIEPIINKEAHKSFKIMSSVFGNMVAKKVSSASKEEIKLMMTWVREVDRIVKWLPVYDDIKIPKDWIEERKKKKKEDRKKFLAKDEGDRPITIRTLEYDSRNDKFKFTMHKRKSKDLLLSTALTIYGFQGEDKLLEAIAPIFFRNNIFLDEFSYTRLNEKRARIIKVALSNEKYLEENPNAHHVKSFINSKQSVIIRHVTAYNFRENMPDRFMEFADPIMEKISPRVYKAATFIKKYIETYYIHPSEKYSPKYGYSYSTEMSTTVIGKKVEQSLMDLFWSNKLFDYYAIKEFNIVREFMKHFPLLLSIDFKRENINIEEIKLYMESKGNYHPELIERVRRRRKVIPKPTLTLIKRTGS